MGINKNPVKKLNSNDIQKCMFEINLRFNQKYENMCIRKYKEPGAFMKKSFSQK